MLFTRCPSCETTFRITDQALHKAGGQVRCGRCSCVFDAYSALREQRDEGEGEGDVEGASKAGIAREGSESSASAVEKALLLEQAPGHEEAFEAAADASRIEQGTRPIDAVAPSIAADAGAAPTGAAEGDGRANAAQVGDPDAAVLAADAFEADAFEADAFEADRSAADALDVSEPDVFTPTPEGDVGTTPNADAFALEEAGAFAASNPGTLTATQRADAAEPTSALDPDEEWLATAALFIVQSAAEPSPPAESPEPTRKAGGAARTGAGRRAGTKRKSALGKLKPQGDPKAPSKAKPQSRPEPQSKPAPQGTTEPQSQTESQGKTARHGKSSRRGEPPPADDVLDDYSVAAVLEQIESSSLPDDAERVEDESIEHEPAARRLAEHESPVHESAEHDPLGSEASAVVPASKDSARVLAFDASDSRGAAALGRDRGRGGDSMHETPSASPVPAAHALPHAVRTAKAHAAIGATTNLSNASTAGAESAAPSHAAASPDAAASTPPQGPRSLLTNVPPFVNPAHRTRAAANIAWLVASVVALLALGAQLTNHFRSDLVTIDGIGPALRNLYARMGIELIPHWDLGQYRIVDWVATAEPNAKGRGSLRITAQIRNEGKRAQPFPYVHLQLKDRWEKSVASRMFRPSEYLPDTARAKQLMPAGATARAELEVIDPGPDAYGFELDVCIERPDLSLHCAADNVFR